MTTRASTAISEALVSGGLADFQGERGRLTVRLLQRLAEGRPVSPEELAAMIVGLDIGLDDASALLDRRTERDGSGHIVGTGLTLNETRHRFTIDGTQVFAWCALDTLTFPIILGQVATIESTSPTSGTTVRLRVGPEGVEEASPQAAVITLPVVDPAEVDTSSVAAIWSTFCHRSFYFPSRAEAETWAEGDDHIEAAALDEGHTAARQLADIFLGE